MQVFTIEQKVTTNAGTKYVYIIDNVFYFILCNNVSVNFKLTITKHIPRSRDALYFDQSFANILTRKKSNKCRDGVFESLCH